MKVKLSSNSHCKECSLRKCLSNDRFLKEGVVYQLPKKVHVLVGPFLLGGGLGNRAHYVSMPWCLCWILFPRAEPINLFHILLMIGEALPTTTHNHVDIRAQESEIHENVRSVRAKNIHTRKYREFLDRK